MIYEAVLLTGVLAVTFLLPHLFLGLAFGVAAPGALLWLHLFAVLLAYFGGFWKHGGQTLAMKTWKIRLVAADRRPLSNRQILLRFLLAWPALALFGVGLLWALVDRERQFLHDRLAGTRLVRTA